MSYTGTDVEIAELSKFSFSFDEEDKFKKVNLKKGPDRYRIGCHEICLEGYSSGTIWDLAESLEENGYRLVDAEATGLTYYSPDGKTEVYLDKVSGVRNEMCRIMVLKGELTEGVLPMAEQELRALFYDL